MSLITPALLRTLRTADPDMWAPLLAAAADANRITTPTRVSAWLPNVLNETGRLSRTQESMNYSVAALLGQWPSHFTPALAKALGRIDGNRGIVIQKANDYWIAEHAYGGRMGNGPPGSGDGYKCRGVGAMQTTGRTNIAVFGTAIRWVQSFQALVDFMATPKGAAESAAQFWQAAGCNGMADRAGVGGDISDIRSLLNVGHVVPVAERSRIIGLKDVQALQREVLAALRLPAGVVVSPAPSRPSSAAPRTTADLNDASLATILRSNRP